MLKKKKRKSIEVQNPDAAGIDIGSKSHYVCIPEGRNEERIKEFTAHTEGIRAMSKWLKKACVKTIAMESTGVYWIPCFQILEQEGFEVILVNARHIKNVPGRKTDIKDCEWIQNLHRFGLLRGAFRPKDSIVRLRSYVRQRDTIIKGASIAIQHMQKALDQMNVKVHHAVTDITGKTGLQIIKEILKGNHDPKSLSQYRNGRIKKSASQIQKALDGDFRKELLFSLHQAYDLFVFYKGQLQECDSEIEKYYDSFEKKTDGAPPSAPKQKSRWAGNGISFDATKKLFNLSGVDLTEIPGISEITAQVIISEVGLDMSKWPSEKQFASWLGVCPNHKITGSKIKSSQSLKVVNKAANALRRSAQSLKHNKSYLGAYYRKMKARLGAQKAITAIAHKLARIVYKLLKFGQPYIDIGFDLYEKRLKDRLLRNLRKSAASLGFYIIPHDPVSAGIS